ncbi:MAG: hypothetical protein GWO20_02000 [Candidatus Korarchaeota archaeon]|nr:hypothetical protein [Candidatus Korarchaeota archaeon]
MGPLSLLPKLNLKFRPKQKELKPASWNYIFKIPELKTIAGPASSKWPQRVKEEIETFQKWRTFQSPPFRKLEKVAKRKFTLEVNLKLLFGQEKEKWNKTEIRIPLNYPYYMPDWRGDLKELVRSYTGRRPFCMPPVFKSWWKKRKGHAGIAHFLQAFLAFISVAAKEPKRMYTLKI